jgi:hypothetical protein
MSDLYDGGVFVIRLELGRYLPGVGAWKGI